MTVKTHFETLASGMKAKLDTRFRVHNNYVHDLQKLYGNGFNAGLLEDTATKRRLTLVIGNK